MIARPLPAAWASRDGWKPARAPETRTAAQLREAEKAACRAVAVRGEAPGLVKKGTSQTEPPTPPHFGQHARREAARAEADSALQALGDEVIAIDPVMARLQRMSRRVKNAAKLHAEGTTQPAAMFTLTHRPGETPDAKDVSRFIDCLRKWATRKLGLRNLRYVWCAELQSGRAGYGDAGAVHYHVAVWLTPELKRRGEAMAARNPRWKSSGVLPKPDKKGWWKKGSTERDWVRKSVRSYLAKYLSKGAGEGGDGGTAATFPRGLRIHGAGGFNNLERVQRAHAALPSWLRKDSEPADLWKRSKEGGGWVSAATGERRASPWVCVIQGAIVKLVRVTQCNFQTVNQYFGAVHRLALA